MSRGFLFPVLLEGDGTPDVEALCSYMCRLSASHQAPLGVLIKACYRWRQQATAVGPEVPFLTENLGNISHYVRPNEMTRSLVSVLSKATDQPNLRSSTFMCLESSLDRCMGAFANTMRWCPHCFQEFEQSGTPAYFKLQWLLTGLSRCHVHGLELLSRCPHCKALQNGYGLRGSCSICSQCDRSLSVLSGSQDREESWRVEGADLIVLMDRIGCEPSLEFPSGGVRRVVQALFDEAWERDDLRGLSKVMNRDECLAITHGITPVTLMRARRIAFRLGVRLVDLLDATIQETAGVLDPAWTDRLPKTMRPKRRSLRHDRKRLAAGLKRILRDDSQKPRPLSRVARDLGVSSGCLRYHFPIQAKEVLRRYREWRSSLKERKQLEARSAVLSYLARNDGMRPTSNKGMLRELRRNTKLPKDVLRHEIVRASMPRRLPFCIEVAHGY